MVSTGTKSTKTSKQIWDEWRPPEHIDEQILFFFSILAQKESNDAGDREFHPTYISSCRVWDTHRLNLVLEAMKSWAYKEQQHRQMKEWNI